MKWNSLGVGEKEWCWGKLNPPTPYSLMPKLNVDQGTTSSVLGRLSEVRTLGSLTLAEVVSWGLKKRSHFYNIKYKGKEWVLQETPIQIIPKITDEVAALNHRFSVCTELPDSERRHLDFRSWKEVSAQCQRMNWFLHQGLMQLVT